MSVPGLAPGDFAKPDPWYLQQFVCAAHPRVVFYGTVCPQCLDEIAMKDSVWTDEQVAEMKRLPRPKLSLNRIAICAEDIEATIPDYPGVTRDIVRGS